MKRILTPTDGSETAKAAAQFAGDIAKAEGAEVVVLGVAHAVQFGDSVTYDPIPEIETGEKGFVDAEVAELQAEGIKATGEVVRADQVFRAIIDAAEKDEADVIVMGTHGRTGLARAIIGSVADRVVRHSKVPVVLVPLR